jgi:GTP cyclohydrolase I
MADTTVKQAFDSLSMSIKRMFEVPEIRDKTSRDSYEQTPKRFAKAMAEYVSGCFEDEHKIFSRGMFRNRQGTTAREYNQMVYVNDIQFVSICEHHLAHFFGRVHFAYIPNDTFVGLSKIPRLVEVLSHRPQIQERLTQQIVKTFVQHVEPEGCGAMIEAVHFCMCARGVRKIGAFTKTTALYGNFFNSTTKQEFLEGVSRKTTQPWV